MRKALALAILLACSGCEQEWQELRNDEHGFVVSLPGAPKHERRTMQSPVGPYDVDRWEFTDHMRRRRWAIEATDFEALKLIDAADWMGSVVEDLRKEAEVTGSREISIAGARGHEVSLRKGAAYCRMRTFVVGSHGYVLAVDSDSEASEDIDRFLESFVLDAR